MSDKVEIYLNGKWTVVELAPDDCRDREPTPKVKPRYKVYVVRTSACDPRAAERVLEWLNSPE